MSEITQKPATKDQLRQIEKVVKNATLSALKALKLTRVDAQRILESHNLAKVIRSQTDTAIAQLLVTDKYKDEEVKSSHVYFSGYTVKPLKEQVAKLKQLYPQLKDSGMMNPGKLPAGAEGWFAILNIWKEKSPLTGSYNNSVVQMLEHFKKAYGEKNYHNYCEGKMGPNRLRQTDHSKEVFEKLSEEQGHPDILIIPAQLGTKHRGLSVRQARKAILDQKNQVGLGVFVIGIILLTNPKRLLHCKDPWIDCAGDEYNIRHGFNQAPYFKFNDGKVRFATSYVEHAGDSYGSASGFLPQ